MRALVRALPRRQRDDPDERPQDGRHHDEPDRSPRPPTGRPHRGESTVTCRRAHGVGTPDDPGAVVRCLDGRRSEAARWSPSAARRPTPTPPPARRSRPPVSPAASRRTDSSPCSSHLRLRAPEGCGHRAARTTSAASSSAARRWSSRASCSSATASCADARHLVVDAAGPFLLENLVVHQPEAPSAAAGARRRGRRCSSAGSWPRPTSCSARTSASAT